MELNLKFFRNIFVLSSTLFLACSNVDKTVHSISKVPKTIDNRLLVILDQSESVNFASKVDLIEDALQTSFKKTYTYVIKATEYYIANITTESNVVATPYPFRAEYPNEESMGKVSYRLKHGEWKSARRKWINEGISKIKSSILSPKSGYTDVYSIFKCIELKSKELNPTDTLNVLFVSDMKHSTKNYELTRLLVGKNAGVFARQEFKRLGIAKKSQNFNCKLIIVTPENFSQSVAITTYWDSFFKEWGLTSSIDWR